MEVIYKLFFANIVEYNNMIIEILLKSIDLSRLNVTALDNNKNNMEKTNIIFKDSNLLIYIKNKSIVYYNTIYIIIIYNYI